jgi:hypothetical protein
MSRKSPWYSHKVKLGDTRDHPSTEWLFWIQLPKNTTQTEARNTLQPNQRLHQRCTEQAKNNTKIQNAEKVV